MFRIQQSKVFRTKPASIAADRIGNPAIESEAQRNPIEVYASEWRWKFNVLKQRTEQMKQKSSFYLNFWNENLSLFTPFTHLFFFYYDNFSVVVPTTHIKRLVEPSKLQGISN